MSVVRFLKVGKNILFYVCMYALYIYVCMFCMFLVVYKAVFIKIQIIKKVFLQQLIYKQNGGLANINSTC